MEENEEKNMAVGAEAGQAAEAVVNPRPVRDAFMAGWRERYPDDDPDDDEKFYERLGKDYERMDKERKASDKLTELFAKDGRSAGLLIAMSKGENPVEYLLEQYGDDFKEYLDDPDNSDKMAKAYAKYTARMAKEAALEKQAGENLQAMLDALDEAKETVGFDDEQARKAYEYLYGDGGLLERIVTNDVRVEDWMLLMKAADYDRMKGEGEMKAKKAEEVGRIEGRNEKIDMERRKRTKAEGMPGNLPAAGGGVGAARKNDTLDALRRLNSDRRRNDY